MSGSNARSNAIRAITSYKPDLAPLNYADTKPTEIYGSNVFSDKVMKERLPRIVYKSLRKTIEQGVQLDPSLADIVASTMKDWAIEKGALHARILSPDGPFRRKARRFPLARRQRRRDHGIQRQDAEPGRSRRLKLPFRRSAQHLRGARLYGLGLYLSCIFA